MAHRCCRLGGRYDVAIIRAWTTTRLSEIQLGSGFCFMWYIPKDHNSELGHLHCEKVRNSHWSKERYICLSSPCRIIRVGLAKVPWYLRTFGGKRNDEHAKRGDDVHFRFGIIPYRTADVERQRQIGINHQSVDFGCCRGKSRPFSSRRRIHNCDVQSNDW